MKFITLFSKEKAICFYNLKNCIIVMYCVIGFFIGTVIACAIKSEWASLIDSACFALWAFVCTRWMKQLQKAYEFFDEAREELEVHRSKTDKK